MPVAGVGSGPGRVLLLHPVVPLAWMGLPPVQMPLPGTETLHDTHVLVLVPMSSAHWVKPELAGPAAPGAGRARLWAPRPPLWLPSSPCLCARMLSIHLLRLSDLPG